MREYLRVTPTSEELDPKGIPRVLASLHKLTNTGSENLIQKLNPLHNSSPPRFEFLALSDGPDEPVEFYYGVDEHLDTFEKRLRSIYPATFDIERVEFEVESRLIPPVEFSREEFVEHLEAGRLQYEFRPDEQLELDADEGDAEDHTPAVKADAVSDGGSAAASREDRILEYADGGIRLAPPSAIPTDESLTALEKPTVTSDGTVLARPAVDGVSPIGVRWCGSGVRKKDWMTSLTPLTFSGGDDSAVTTVDDLGGTLTTLIEHLMEATAPVAFQVVFQQ